MTIDRETLRRGVPETTDPNDGGREPVEGPDDPDASDEVERRDDLARRTDEGRPTPAAGGAPDILPDVDVPEHQM